MKNSLIPKRLLYTSLNKTAYTFILFILTITFSSLAQNTIYGTHAGNGSNSGNKNSFFGYRAGDRNTGDTNAFFGHQSGRSNTSGGRNTFLGYGSGASNVTGRGNLFIGFHAGYYETGSNKLYIHNESRRDPLIWGDFTTRILNINGNLGIGTTTPTEKLHVKGNIITNNVFIGDVGHNASWAGFAHSSQVGVGKYALLAHSSGSHTLINKVDTGNGFIGFRVGNSDKMVLTNSGNLGIGKTNPTEKLDIVGNVRVNNGNVIIGQSRLSSSTDNTNTMLTVSGGVKTDKVVLNIGSFPDYVFANDYQLMPIEEVADYVAKNKHLPNIPSEKEMVATGLDVRAISVKLVEKIEELTLYIIAQQENIESQKETNTSLQVLLASQQELINKLAQRLEKLEKSK